MTPLTDDEKRSIVALFADLRAAIDQQADDTAVKYRAFQDAYRGASRAFIHDFEKAHTWEEQSRWVGRLRFYLSDEIESSFWSPGSR